MKLRTSFFNGRVLLKNMTRFAPVWVLYTIAEVLGLLTLDMGAGPYQIADDLRYILGPVSLFHGIYGLIVAACLFGDLFDSRLCNGLHAMPMRREGWLLTNYVSGLVFGLIPAVVGGAVAIPLLQSEWWLALVWQGTSLLQYLFFFGLAVFSAMCAGKRLGMIAIYSILNLFSVLIRWVAELIFIPLLPGVVLPVERFAFFSPVVFFNGNSYIDYYCDAQLGGFFRGFISDEWMYLFACAGLGVVLVLLAWAIYRKRPLETAGDFVSFRPMRIFFLLAYTLAMGAMLYSCAELFFGTYRDYGFLVVGILIGWFTGWMLLERTVKIFNKKVLLGLVAFAAVFTGGILLTRADPAGISGYIPETEKIKEANLYLQSDVFYYHNEDESWGGRHITEPAQIRQVQELHSQLIHAQERSDVETVTVYVRYRLQNDRIIYRTYQIAANSKTAENLNAFLSDPRSVFHVDDWQQVKDTVKYVCVYWAGEKLPTEIYDTETIAALLAAIEADCKAGNFTQHDYFHTAVDYVAGIDINWTREADPADRENGGIPVSRGNHVIVYADSLNTAAFLKTLE